MAGLVVLALAPPGWAQAPDPAPYALGDWKGVRQTLHDRGVDLQVTYVNEIASNARGGESREASYADQIMLDANFDLERIGAPEGASLHATLTNRNGVDLNEKGSLGLLLSPQEIYGYGRTTRLAQLYYQQTLMAGRVTVKLGRLPMSGDIFPFSCEFQNLGFCGAVPGYITPNWHTWPASQWAAAIKSRLAEKLWLQTAVYQVNPTFTRPDQGLELGNPSGTTGAHAVAELTWTPHLAGLGGAYRIGVWRNTGKFEDLYFNEAGSPIGQDGGRPRRLNHASGYYLMAEQPLHPAPGDPRRGPTVFANFIQSDEDVSVVGSVREVGVFWRGPLASRPQDTLGLALGRLGVNRKVRRRIAQENRGASRAAPTPHAEYPLELFYGWAATPTLTVRPNLQYIHNPGGLAAKRDVIVLGLKTSASF
ncbi:carbohydrate porin [Caulobacter sp. 602-1]|uniref:carbohydrate porin n=1 Tax=Caulobacter sp. 602-1 TaxID=2492472 RepID=UPI000F63A80C|nr:carbohydrate porin [Caulobacter sp. 602-1]RRN63997.1 carbohydrate porin [Caulobacter sp. 602-1]